MNRLIYILFLGALLSWVGCTSSKKTLDTNVENGRIVPKPIKLTSSLPLDENSAESDLLWLPEDVRAIVRRNPKRKSIVIWSSCPGCGVRRHITSYARGRGGRWNTVGSGSVLTFCKPSCPTLLRKIKD